MSKHTLQLLRDLAEDELLCSCLRVTAEVCYFETPSRHGACDECSEGEVVDLPNNRQGLRRVCAICREKNHSILDEYAIRFLLHSVAQSFKSLSRH